MDDYQSLSHSVWECKYHVVFIPKYRRKAIYGELRKELGRVFRTLARQKECEVEEGHLMPDHVHMLISISPNLEPATFRWLKAAQRPFCRLGRLTN